MVCPVAIFAYKRPKHLQQAVSSLLVNPEAADTDVFIFCDAPKESKDQAAVSSVRAYAKTVTGFKKVTVVERETNFGLSRSITAGVGQLCRCYGRVAVVEDDVLVSEYFLSWVNAALDKYENDDRVLSVGCYVFPTQMLLPENFFLQIPDCWGWAVWERSWHLYRSDGASLLRELMLRCLENRFDFEGSYPYTKMLRAQIHGENDSWAVRWYATLLLANGLTVYPGQSMTRNIGFDGSGRHCAVDDKYEVQLSDRRIAMLNIPVIESEIGRQAWREFFMKSRPQSAIELLMNRLKSGIRIFLQ